MIVFAGKTLCSSYRQALKIKRTLPALRMWMRENGIADVCCFEQWLSEEREWLSIWAGEPVVETLQMEYYQHLVNLNSSEYQFSFCLLACLLTVLQTGLTKDLGGESNTGKIPS